MYEFYVTLINRDLWYGDLLNDKPHGRGRYISKHSPDGGTEYEGLYENGHRTGKEKISWPSGDIPERI